MHPPDSQTVSSSASVRKLESAPRSFMQEDQWVLPHSRQPNTSSSEMGRSENKCKGNRNKGYRTLRDSPHLTLHYHVILFYLKFAKICIFFWNPLSLKAFPHHFSISLDNALFLFFGRDFTENFQIINILKIWMLAVGALNDNNWFPWNMDDCFQALGTAIIWLIV